MRRWILGAAAIGFAYLVYSYLTLPDVRPLRTANPETTAFIELRAREALAEGRPVRRVQRWVSYGRISADLKRAVLVAEDDAFWQHEGWTSSSCRNRCSSIGRAAASCAAAARSRSSSPRTCILSPSKNPVRKLRELVIARRLEAELTKSRILELYLNVIEWGDGVYGAEAAARTYFHTSAAALGRAESALLAGAIVNPRELNPSHPTARLVGRQQLILRRMGGVVPPIENPVVVPPDNPPSFDDTPPIVLPVGPGGPVSPVSDDPAVPPADPPTEPR